MANVSLCSEITKQVSADTLLQLCGEPVHCTCAYYCKSEALTFTACVRAGKCDWGYKIDESCLQANARYIVAVAGPLALLFSHYVAAEIGALIHPVNVNPPDLGSCLNRTDTRFVLA